MFKGNYFLDDKVDLMMLRIKLVNLKQKYVTFPLHTKKEYNMKNHYRPIYNISHKA